MSKASIINYGLFATARLISMLSTLAYARWLGVDELGKWELVLTTYSILIPLLSLQLPAAFFRYADSVDEKNVIKFIIGKIGVLLPFIYILAIGVLLLPLEYWMYALPISVIHIIFQMHVEFFRRIKGNFFYVKKNFEVVIVGFCLSMIFINTIFPSFYGVVIAEFIAVSVGVFSCVSCFKRTCPCPMDKKRWKFNAVEKQKLSRFIGYCLPLIPNIFAWWAMSFGCRYVVAYHMNVGAVGVLVVHSKIPNFGATLMSFVVILLQNKFLDDRRNGVFWKEYFRLLWFYLGGAFLLSTILYLVTKTVLPIWLGDQVLFDIELVFVLSVLSLLYAIVGYSGVVYMVFEANQKALLSTVMGMIVAFLSLILLIDDFGLVGVPLSLALGFGVTLSLRIAFIKKLESMSEF